MAFAPGLLVFTVVLSSLRTGDATLPTDIPRSDGITVKLSTIPVVLGGDVNLTFHFPSNFSTAELLTLYGFVYDGPSNKGKLLHTGMSQLRNDSLKVIVHFPCAIFDHPASYQFKYRISDKGPVRSLNQSLSLGWGEMQLTVPTNHTALSRLGYWIYHKRRCPSKNYRDKINLYYIGDSRREVAVFNKSVRRLRVHGDFVGRTRMVIKCNILDAQGTFFIEYHSGFNDVTLARSRHFNVYWGDHPLISLQKTIYPCKFSLPLSFPRPECARAGDLVQVFQRGSDRLVTQKYVLPGMSSIFFPCTRFKANYFGGYCFHYVIKSQTLQSSTILSKLCIRTFEQGKSNNEGWNHWLPWGMCSSSCGEGKQHRYRYCLSTSSHQTENCRGNSVQIRSCPLSPCPDNPRSCACGCQLTAREGMIISSPALFKKMGRTQCIWRINLWGGARIRLWFDALKMDGDTILVRDGNDSSATLLATVKDGFSSSVVSKGNNMYIFYSHNGKWTNGTKRGFTASYRAEEEQLFWRKRTLGTAEATFLAVFIFSILTLGIVLFVVFLKLRRQQCNPSSPSSGSSSTSDSTSRSTIPSSPHDDEASSNEPLRNEPLRNEKSHGHERTNRKRERGKRRRRRNRRRTQYLCDVTIPRCSCAEVSGLESGSGSFSANNDLCTSSRRTGVERTYVPHCVPPAHGCDCAQCLCDIQKCMNCDTFRVPSKKYYGDWMVTEGLNETTYGPLRPGDLLTYHRDSCTECRNSNEDFV